MTMRGFSEAEKEQIRQKLFEVGCELFGTYGLKKTGIREIARAVGISQGAFYLFFPSKEALYFAILEREEEKIKTRLLETAMKEESSGFERVKNLLLEGLKQVYENKIVRRLYMEKEYMPKLPLELLENHNKRDLHDLMPLVDAWAQEGIIRPEKPELIAGMIRAFFLLPIHQREIGEDVFPETMEKLAESIALYLTTGAEKGEAHRD
jgi:AcrR family transcriptional regulator